jgi:ABC-2 type transport system ATP-binding protein
MWSACLSTSSPGMRRPPHIGPAAGALRVLRAMYPSQAASTVGGMTQAHADGAALAVRTTGLTKHFGDRKALDGVDLQVPRGVAFGFLGPNGAGKTTIIRLLLGLAWPTSGTMSVLGHPVPGDRRAALGRVGAVGEEPRFQPQLTGRENLRVNAAARGGAARDRIPAALERVGLSARADERISAYSLGMKQRLGIARCLLADPELLILDEPMNGLDPAGMLEFRGLIKDLVAEGRTVFLSSHLLDEVQRTCDFAAIVDRGRVITQGPIHALSSTGRAIAVGTDDPPRAATLLARLHGVESASVQDGGVKLAVTANGQTDRELITAIVRQLLDAGMAIDRVAPVEGTLEERFLNLTTGLKEER